MADKIGVYFDEASLGGALDLQKLCEDVQKKWRDACPVVKTHPCLASSEGHSMIQADIDAGAIDAVCVCGSSPRVDWDFYQFGADILVDRVNLRELCVLCYADPSGQAPVPGQTPELLYKMANDYVNMGVIKLQKSGIPQKEDLEVVRRVLVIGGGWAGLTAALHVASVGYDVTLVEKKDILGGAAVGMYKTAPFRHPYDAAHSTGVEQKIADVRACDRIEILLSSEVQAISGAPGNYEVTLSVNGEERGLSVGAVVVATGWVPQDTSFLKPFGYGTLKNVLTSREFEALAKGGAITRPSDGEKPRKIMFLTGFGDKLEPFADKEAEALAAAQADAGKKEESDTPKTNFIKQDTYRHLPYTSELTSLAALKQANYVREFIPDGVAMIVYEHMMMPGLNELYYKAAQNDPGVMMTKGVLSEVRDEFFTLAEVTRVDGSPGAYEVTVRIRPRHAGPNSPDLSGLCGELNAEVPNDFDFGLSTRKAVYMDAPFAFPQRYVVDKAALSSADKAKVQKCGYFDLNEEEKEITLNVGSIVIATGWKPYDVKKLTNLGAGEIENCITNMQMERLASPFGPTNGKILRPSDGNAPRKVAFVQCAGSRDENHLHYCSYICCMASLKQAQYVREQYPDAEVTIYYIDLRTPGRYENFARKILSDENVRAVKGKVAAVVRDKTGDDVWVTVEDAVSGAKSVERFDLVVLATGMQPSLADSPLPLDISMDAEGFIQDGGGKGIFAAGCAKQPLDVTKSAQSATGAAMQAIQTVRGR